MLCYGLLLPGTNEVPIAMIQTRASKVCKIKLKCPKSAVVIPSSVSDANARQWLSREKYLGSGNNNQRYVPLKKMSCCQDFRRLSEQKLVQD